MKFSFLTYQFARYPLEYCFYMAKEYGFNGVEVWGARPHAYAYDMDNTMIRQVIDWTSMSRTRVRRMVRKYLPILIALLRQA